jgi:hypothetical protein
MSIDPTPDLDLDALREKALARQLLSLEKKKQMLATLVASADKAPQMKAVLCSVRASGISPLLLIRKPVSPLSKDAVLELFGFLREWDQLLLRNLLEVASDSLPAVYHPLLFQEAKTELKWFQEWQTAVSDPRLHRYPGLPWRSFLRKVNAENYEFAQNILRDDTAENRLESLVEAFLRGKKKTICIFPKNWGRK